MATTVQVEGLLQSNTNIRNEMLRRNLGKYFQYEGPLSPAIGEAVNVDWDKKVKSSTDGKGLLRFTHEGGTPFSNFINKRYFVEGREKEIYRYTEPTPEQIQPWTSDTQDYIQYIDEILGEDVVMRHINYVNDFLAGRYMENALRRDAVGVVRDYNVATAIQGAVTTNINNFSGKDTKLGLITNQIYSNSLYRAAIYNSDRMNNQTHVGSKYIQKAYLTPSLYNQYGNNLANVFRLTDILRLEDGEQRVREELGKDVTFNAETNNLGVAYLQVETEDAEQYRKEQGYTNKTYARKRTKISEDNVLDTYQWELKGYSVLDKTNNKDYLTAPNQMYIFNETDNGNDRETNDIQFVDDPSTGQFNTFHAIEGFNEYNKDSLLAKTNTLFNSHKIATMIGRFHTSLNDSNGLTDEAEFIDTAKAGGFGNSKGRNLLKLDAITGKKYTTNGYDNPYCRVWTFHHQYSRYKDLIRPFMQDSENPYTMKDIQKMNAKYRALDDGSTGNGVMDGIEKLANNTVLQNNGLVRITPKGRDGETNKKVKDCMFAIENLAWKDYSRVNNNLSEEQIGPNGGRIMWFPPYNLNFNESVNVGWNDNTFIGRGEKIYTYKNTDRTGTLSFSLLIDHPAIVNRHIDTEGMGAEKDVHADILRFFAGCSLLDGTLPEVTGSTIPPSKIPPIGPKSETMKFTIYFPNNFSGVISNAAGKGKWENDITGEYDLSGSSQFDKGDFWWRYLLIGNNTCITNQPEQFSGYEMNPPVETGSTVTGSTVQRTLTNTPESGDTEYSSRWIQARFNQVRGDRNSGNPVDDYYHYHCDDDLKQVLRTQGSYIDESSSGYNAVINGTRSEGEYTFAEVMLALMKITNSVYYTEGGYRDYCVEKCKVDQSYVDKLVSKFTDKGFKLKTIKVGGGADVHDRSNSDMLARRRAYVTKQMFKTFFAEAGIEIDQNVFAPEEAIVGGKENDTVSNNNNKKARSVTVTIEYNTGETQKLSDGTAAQPIEEQDSEFLTYDEFKEIILDNSDVLTIYSQTPGVTDEDFDTIVKTIVEWKDNLIRREDIEDETKRYSIINGYIDMVLSHIATEWIELAYSISMSPTYNEFITKARQKTNGLNEASPKTQKAYNEYKELEAELSSLKQQDSEYAQTIADAEQKIKDAATALNNCGEDDDTDATKYTGIISEQQDIVDNNMKLSKKTSSAIAKTAAKTDKAYKNYLNSLYDDSKTDQQLQNQLNNKIDKLEEVNKKLAKLDEEIAELMEDPSVEKKKNAYEEALNKLNNAVSNSETNRTKVRSATKVVNNTYKAYQSAQKIRDDKVIVKNDKVQQKQRERANIKSSIESIQKRIDDFNKRNDIDTNLALAFMYYTGQSYDANKGEGDDAYKAGVFNTEPERNTVFYPLNKVYDDEGDERVDGDDTVEMTLSFEKMFNHYLLIDYVSDEYAATYGDNLYKFFVVLNDRDDVSYCENNVWYLFANSVGCGNACTEDNKQNAREAKYNLDEYFAGIENEVKAMIQQEIEDAREAEKQANSQKLVENNVDKENEELRAKEEIANESDVRWAKYGINATGNRYENEAEYFKSLSVTDPVLFKSLKDKFRYFDPAFHSITPEGFNARLTFLHQCTRQGGTIEATSSNTGNDAMLTTQKGGTRTAANLAFGRMPVCVIRIGDFIHTRAIINSMTIDYGSDKMQWDLNPEGAGVQPMYANISLSLTILGGQSLEAPVNRLQNALSFNYYANTEVYDNRADSVQYDGNDSIQYTHLFDAYRTLPATNANTVPADNQSDVKTKG